MPTITPAGLMAQVVATIETNFMYLSPEERRRFCGLYVTCTRLWRRHLHRAAIDKDRERVVTFMLCMHRVRQTQPTSVIHEALPVELWLTILERLNVEVRL